MILGAYLLYCGQQTVRETLETLERIVPCQIGLSRRRSVTKQGVELQLVDPALSKIEIPFGVVAVILRRRLELGR